MPAYGFRMGSNILGIRSDPTVLFKSILQYIRQISNNGDLSVPVNVDHVILLALGAMVYPKHVILKFPTFQQGQQATVALFAP